MVSFPEWGPGGVFFVVTERNENKTTAFLDPSQELVLIVFCVFMNEFKFVKKAIKSIRKILRYGFYECTLHLK